jgi:thiosulfate dehydrogenase [quinone] large subunit
MGTTSNNYSSGQLIFLVALRWLIGWHFLYEGVVKLWNPGWTSRGYLMDSQGFFSGLFQNLAANPGALRIADFLNVWGLIFIGLALLLGAFARWAAIGGMVMLALFYLSHPPFIGAQYALPSEGSYLFVNKNLIELAALGVVAAFPTSHIVGLSRLWQSSRNKASAPAPAEA